MTTDHDERRGLPSASEMHRIHHCPASHQMAKHAPKSSSRDAEIGTLGHAVLSDDVSADEVPYSVADIAERCEDQIARLLTDWTAEGDEPVKCFKEVRYGLTAFGTVLEMTLESRGDFVFSGQADRLYVQGNHGLLIDTKTLYGHHDHAAENYQISSLTVLTMIKHKLVSLRAAIVQPRKGQPTTVEYDLDSLKLAHDLLLTDLLRESQATPDDRRAGDHCHHCDARFGCDVFKLSALNQVEKIDPMSIASMDGKTQRSAMFARAMELSPESHIGAYRGLAIVKRYIDAIEGSFKQRVEAGEIPGFSIATKPGNREITDPEKAFNALVPLGVTTEDVLAACTIPVGAMEEAVRIRSGIKSKTEKRTTYNLTAKEAKDALNAALEAAGALGRKADKAEIIETANGTREKTHAEHSNSHPDKML